MSDTGNNGEIKIEKGIPIPIRTGHKKYPWEDLEVGDSFFCPGKLITQMNGAMCPPTLRKQRKFTARTRTLEDDNEEGVRIWRIK